MSSKDISIVIPLANEGGTFDVFIAHLSKTIDKIRNAHVYLVVDKVSHDNTRELCERYAQSDQRYTVVWAPQNKNVVDAYLAGYRAAWQDGAAYMIEMDAGLSHNPDEIFPFIKFLRNGSECVYGSRFMNGGSLMHSSATRRILSSFGTTLRNLCPGTDLSDMTSGFQGFSRDVVGSFLAYGFKSTGHFYQSELKYLLRDKSYEELPISYKCPSDTVATKSIINSIALLAYYTGKRLIGKPKYID